MLPVLVLSNEKLIEKSFLEEFFGKNLKFTKLAVTVLEHDGIFFLKLRGFFLEVVGSVAEQIIFVF